MPGFPLGAFVWTNSPFGQPAEVRDRPGPVPHIAYHLGSQRALILLAYTSSGAWRGGGLGVPAGVVVFDAEAAAAVNQRAFHLDLRILAYVALTADWFPRLGAPDHGVIAVASKAVQLRILDAGRALAGRRETVEVRGVGSDTTSTTRRR